MIRLDGKIASESVRQSLKEKVDHIKRKGLRPPHLAAILVGHDGASETYVASKVKNCQQIGYTSTLIRFEETAGEAELLSKIRELNEDPRIDGILVQLPLPKHISERKVIETINPDKDVDGFHPINTGKLVQGLPTFLPATPFGIMLLLEHYNIKTAGMNAAIIGRSNIVGRPMSILLSTNGPYGNCTVTLCHSKTKNLKEITLNADLIVAALGVPGFLKGDMVKEGAVIIDVGITRVPDSTAKNGFRLKGDVLFEEVAPKAFAITPVPGGVGPMTIAGLLTNTLEAYKKATGYVEE